MMDCFSDVRSTFAVDLKACCLYIASRLSSHSNVLQSTLLISSADKTLLIFQSGYTPSNDCASFAIATLR
jgi:hypothetical protein